MLLSIITLDAALIYAKLGSDGIVFAAATMLLLRTEPGHRPLALHDVNVLRSTERVAGAGPKGSPGAAKTGTTVG